MATNFLLATGTNGFIATPFFLINAASGNETGFSALANGSAVTSSVSGTSGVFTQTNSASAIWSDIFFNAGGAFTPSLGGTLTGWFLESIDGGTTFEAAIATASSTVPAVSRDPDFVIQLDNAAYASGNMRIARAVRMPTGSYKTIVQNNSGAALFTGTTAPNVNWIKCAPWAVQY